VATPNRHLDRGGHPKPSSRPRWRSHGAERSRVTRAGDFSIPVPPEPTVEKTGKAKANL
jgi:hypothetical protein